MQNSSDVLLLLVQQNGRLITRVQFNQEFDDIARSLISFKCRLQHDPKFLLIPGVAFVWPPCSTLLNPRMSTKLTIFAQNIMARVCSLGFLGRFKTLTRCNRLPTSFKTALHRPTMLDLTVLDDAGSVWPGLNY